MTFNFGDRVKYEMLGECVVINSSEQGCYVMNEKGEYAIAANPEELELIPEPDTVRLDWIEECAIKIAPFSIPSYAGDYYGGWELSSEHTNGTFIYDMPYAGEELRECIDVAMEQEKK